MDSLLTEVRRATQSLHERVEARMALDQREWDASLYGRLLTAFHGFYSRYEDQVWSWPQWQRAGLQVEERYKLPRLERDLAAMGVFLPVKDGQAVGQEDEGLFAGFPAAMGAAYVMEGSTLGGQILVRHFRAILEPGQSGPMTGEHGSKDGGQGASFPDGLEFFASYGGRVGPMWRNFLDVFERLSSGAAAPEVAAFGPQERDETVLGAQAAFCLMERQLEAALGSGSGVYAG